MNSRTRKFAITAIFAFTAMAMIGVVSYALLRGGLTSSPEALKPFVPYIAGSLILLLLVFVFSLVPLFLQARGPRTTYGAWAILALGLAIATPLALRYFAEKAPLVVPAKNSLSANIGMTLEEVRQNSGLTLADPKLSPASTRGRVMAEVVFNFQITGTGMVFPGCRYYWLGTEGKDKPRIVEMNIGISPRMLTRAELIQSHKSLRKQLEQDGWSPGQINFKTPEERAQYGGPYTGRGYFWAKDDTLLQLAGKRLDPPKPGENPQTAGEWVIYLQMGMRDDPRYAKVEFSKPAS